ncbi:MAG: 50S ribosomal protein L35 [Caldilineaceae bacterium]|nr:50S ribosomal protein L35 [Caldilineaceae bacterium]
MMPKQKTHKGTAKRFRLTKNGKLMRMKIGRSHLRRKKSAKVNREYRHAITTESTATIKMVQTLAGAAVQS